MSRKSSVALVGLLLASGLCFAQAPKKVLFDHTGWEEGGTSAEWVICSASEPNPSPASPTSETQWNGGISAWAFDLYKKGYTVQTLPASGGRITYGDSSNAQDLSNYAVYVIPECYRYFTATEKQAIYSFVANGGGLYMMGNHDGSARVTSTHPGSTDAFHVFNDFLGTTGTSFGFSFVDGHGPGDSLANTVSNAVTTGTSAMENALVRGANGTVSSMDFHSYAYIRITGSNVKPIVTTQVTGDPSNDHFVVAGTVGSGRFVAIGDSAPSDDGTTTTSGKSLIDGYHAYGNRAFLLNAVDWLASGAATGGVTAAITQPAANTNVQSGMSVAFAGSATTTNAGSPLSYAWSFGDGGTASGASANHVYTLQASTPSATYTVTFTATDGTGAKGTATRQVLVSNEYAPLQATIAAPSSNVTVASGTPVSFSAMAQGGSGTYTYTWGFGDGSTATGASVSHTYTNTGSSAVNESVLLTVRDSVNAAASASRTVTVNPAGTGGGTELIKNGTFESGSTSWSGTSGLVANWSSSGEAAHGGSQCAWLCGYGVTTTDNLYQQVAIPGTVNGATLSFWLHIDTDASTTTAYDTLAVQVRNAGGTILKTLATYSNVNAASGYVQKSFDLSAYKGQTVQIFFQGKEDSTKQTSFVIDDVSVKTN